MPLSLKGLIRGVKNVGDVAAAWLVVIHHEILLVAVVGLAIGGLDDLVMDLLFFARKAWRDLFVYRRHDRMTTATLPPSIAPGRLAIFVPAWHEAEVIGPMLRHALTRWGHADYRIIVGVYPNDPDTIAAVADVALDDPRVRISINDRPGPTTKADCLNGIWRAMLADEQASGIAYKAILLHDAEDVVHADEIRLFDFMIDRFAMVQLPVLPLLSQSDWLSRAVANHYGDEFAESHSKLLTVREALGASVPSAGVACAFERHTLARLAPGHGHGPFDPTSLTEDYEAGLRIRDMGGRGVFVRMRDAQGEMVATREYFPDSIDAAVRQKARWIVGISLAGWDRLGWRGGPAEWWMRIRDRRSALAAFVLTMAYLAMLLWVILVGLELFGAVKLKPLSPELCALMSLTSILMLWRGVIRALFVGRCYGWRQGLASIPRTFIANYIAIFAARRAMLLYIRSLLGNPLAWDKTQHRFPDLSSAP